MRRRALATITAATLLAGLAPAALTVPVAAAATADGGFSTVADLTFHATSVASVADGSKAYVAGISGGNPTVVLVDHSGTKTPVALAAKGTRVQLGRLAQETTGAYALVTGSGPATLWRIVGTTATKMALPATTPVSHTAFTPVTLAGNDVRAGVFLAVDTTDATGAQVSTDLFYDATTNAWTELNAEASAHGTTMPVAESARGSFAATVRSNMTTRPTGAITATGVMITATGGWGYGPGDRPVGILPSTTGTPWQVPADLVEIARRDSISARPWGAQAGTDGVERGWCGDFGSFTCEAPAYPISAATLLSDGRVLMGGRNTAADGTTPTKTAAPAGFSLTDVNEVHTTTVPGTVGNIVDDLSAATTGLKAWAITFDGTTTHVQDADLALFKAPTRPVPPVGVVPAGAAFAPVAPITGYTPQDVAMPSTTTGYVAGATSTDPATGGTVRAQRIAPDGTLHEVTFQGMPRGPVGTKADLVTADGHTGLLVTGGAQATLWELAGDTAYRATLPDTVNGAPFAPTALAADSATSVWVTGTRGAGAAPAAPDAVHWNGTVWEGAGRPDDIAPTYSSALDYAYAANGTLFQPYATGPRYVSYLVERRRPGTSGIAAPTAGGSGGGGETFTSTWTMASADDYTMWGYTRNYGGPSWSYCKRVVNNVEVGATDTASNPCVAPAFPVSASTRLGDGRVVLGGTTKPGGPTPAFALVQGDGSTPVTIPGTVGTSTVALAAAPAGGLVLAVTQGSNGYSLQYADLGAGATANARSFTATALKAAPKAATTINGFLPNRTR